MEMPRLNIKQVLPQIGIRSSQCKMEMTTTQAEVHSKYTPPKGVGWSQPKSETNPYESRKAYGARNNKDYAAERAQEGISKMRQGMSKRNADAQDMIKRGAKKGTNLPAEHAKSDMMAKFHPSKGLEMIIPPPPTFQVTQKSETTGEMDPGSYKTTITPADAFAHGKFTPAQAETYIKQEGSIDRWITYGEYDRRA